MTITASVSTLTVTPDPHHRPGAAATAEPHKRTRTSAEASALARATRSGYRQWLAHVVAAGQCTRPVQLAGQVHDVHPATGEIRHTTSTGGMPDAVIYKACGNRRAAVCPACAEVYRADTYHLIHAGIAGGKELPESVRGHPFAFVTLTAPSFGLVHTTRASNGRPRPCRPRRNPKICLHGVTLACPRTHTAGDPIVGQPLCLDCYDHDHQVVWNVMVGELWRRTITTVAKHARHLDARVSFGKVAEMQARGAVHFHAILRLDHRNPDLRVTPDGRLIDVPAPPPRAVTFDVLAALLEHAVQTTTFRSPAHRDAPDGWLIQWGRQLDIRPVQATTRQQLGTGPISETAVAGYLAKYATKATETTGHTSTRLTPATIRHHADPNIHVGRLLAACWRLGRPGAALNPLTETRNGGRLSYTRLRRWAHMLGFGGHFSTKSRRYSTTLGALRQARIDWRRGHSTRRLRELGDNATAETTLLVGHLTFVGIGWRTTGDALLATTAAARAREHRRTGREELAHVYGRRLGERAA